MSLMSSLTWMEGLVGANDPDARYLKAPYDLMNRWWKSKTRMIASLAPSWLQCVNDMPGRSWNSCERGNFDFSIPDVDDPHESLEKVPLLLLFFVVGVCV
jgi:hypothetical protein